MQTYQMHVSCYNWTGFHGMQSNILNERSQKMKKKQCARENLKEKPEMANEDVTQWIYRQRHNKIHRR